MLQLNDGINIYSRILDHGADKWLIVTHGIGEHLGRNNFFEEFNDYNIFQYDLRGHGKSEGKRAYIETIQHYVDDLEQIIKYLSSDGKPYALFGHSMGALITAAAIQQKRVNPEKVFLSSPPVELPGLLGKLVSFLPTFLFSMLQSIPLSIPLGGMVDINFLSHDKKIIDSYLSDKLNILKLHSRLLISLVATSKRVFSRPLECKVPLFCVVGSKDGIVAPKSVMRYFSEVETNSQLKVIEGGFHELHNELDEFRIPYLKFLRESL